MPTNHVVAQGECLSSNPNILNWVGYSTGSVNKEVEISLRGT
ncbi:MAG TPA: hypothetical protein VLY04_01040 [Bryobacteraceae bacterium]|nr:hypothetical protein [Bryobacteraceae bacterium]